MKYLLLSPIVGYYILRDMAALTRHGDLLRGLALFVLSAVVIILLCFSIELVKELSKVKKQIGNDAYEWMVQR